MHEIKLVFPNRREKEFFIGWFKKSGHGDYQELVRQCSNNDMSYIDVTIRDDEILFEFDED